MEYKSNILENLTPDFIQLSPSIKVDVINDRVAVGPIQGATFISRFIVKSTGDSDNQIVLQHSGNGVPIVGIGQESSHGSLQLRLNSGATQVRLSAINNNYILPNLGIGVTGPLKKLHVKESTTATYAAYIENSIAGGDYLAMIGDAGDPVFEFDSGGTGGEAQMKMYSDNVLKNLLDANGSSYFSNSVGIGVSSPQAKLEIGSSSGAASGQYNSPSALLISTSGGSAGAGGTLLFGADGSSASDVQWSISNSNTGSNATGSIGNLNFNTKQTLAGTVLLPAMTILSGGNVGIGLTGPGSRLSIGGTTGSYNSGIGFQPTGTGARVYRTFIATDGSFRFDDASVGTRYCINSSGNFGIGTINPTSALSIAKVMNAAFVADFINTSVSGHGLLIQAGGTTGTRYITQWKDALGTERFHMDDTGEAFFQGKVGIGITTNTTIPLHVNQGSVSGTVIKASGIGAIIEIQASSAGNATLYQRPNVTGDKEAEFRMTLGSTYGWSWIDDNSNAGSRIKYMKLQQSNGTLTVKGDIVAFGAPSDRRYKDNIKPIESALDKAMKLEGVTFDWKESDSILDIKEDIGFIAQDVQKVVPELVRENKDGKLSLRYQGITPILLEAIKELKAEIEELKKKIK